MKIRNIYIVILSLMLTVSSCDFGDTNVDPANPSEVSIPLMLPTAEARIAYWLGGDASRYNGVFTQHFAGSGRQHLLIGRYGFTNTDVTSSWNQMYAGSLQDLQVIFDLAAVEGSATADQYTGAAKVLTAYSIAMFSDMFEDIPYSEALQGIENVEPAYDSRDLIYSTAHTMLDEAIDELAVDSELALGSEDLIYGGDASLWIKAAYSIQARLYLHEGNYDAALTAAASGFTSIADDMEFAFGTTSTETNPWYQFEEQRGDVVMGEYFIDMLNDLSDPRIEYFAVPTESGAYVGAPAGNPNGGESVVTDLTEALTLAMTSRSSAVPFITYSELKFIEAEAHLRKSGADAAAAADAANAGIEASLEKVTGSVSSVYMAANSFSSGDIDLESLIGQKYLALFAQTETWNDYRRTGYPQIDPVGDNNQLGAGLIPLRWPLPQSEELFNFDNYSAHVADIEVPTVLNGFTWDATPQ